MTLRALTLHRPWAWLIAHDTKRVENRDWEPPEWMIGQYLAIHAGKTWDQDGADFARMISTTMPRSSADHPIGIVAVCKVVGVIHPDAEPPSALIEGLDMRWYMGSFGWVLSDVVAIDTVPCRGAQGLWFVPSDELAKVRAGWRKAKGTAT